MLRVLLICLIGLLLCPPAMARGPIDCAAPESIAAAAGCDVVGRIDPETVLRRFSVEDGSSQRYSQAEFEADLFGGITVESRIVVDDNLEQAEFGYAHLSFRSHAICGTRLDRIVECIGSIPQRNNGASCRHEYVSTDAVADLFHLLICDAVIGWGTGVLEQGELYFIVSNGLRYVGYFPTHEEEFDPVQNIGYEFDATDSLSVAPDGRWVILDRCIEVKVNESVGSPCEKHRITTDGGVASVEGRSSWNTRLRVVYEDMLPFRRKATPR